MLGRGKAAEAIMGALAASVVEHVTSMRNGLVAHVRSAEATVVRMLHEAEDRANGRQHAAMVELGVLAESLVEIGSKVDTLLEHEARARNEQKVVRKRLDQVSSAHAFEGQPVSDLCTVCGRGRSEHASVQMDFRALDDEAAEPEDEPVTREEVAELVEDVVEQVVQDTMTGLPGPSGRRLDEAVGALGENGSAPMPKQATSTTELVGWKHAGSLFPGVGTLQIRDAIVAGEIAGGVKRPGRSGGWSAPRLEIAKWVATLESA